MNKGNMMNRLNTLRMNRQINYVIVSVITAILLALTGLISHSEAQIAVKGETVYTMNGSAITNGVILINDGKIEAVGSESDVSIPGGYDVHEAKVVTPGLIDAHTVVGLAGYYNQDHDQDQLETSNAVQPELRAIDSYNAREFLVQYLNTKGMTTIHTGHGPGAVISGQTLITKTAGETVEESLIEPSKMLAMTLGSGIRRNFSSPGTRSKAVAVLRQELIKAKEYAEKRAEGEEQSRNLKSEALADLLDGEMTALVTAHTSHDIITALRIQEEFGFDMVLDGAAEAYLVIAEIKEAGVPVIIHPPMIRPSGDAKNANMETAAMLADAGIPIAFQSGYESYVPKSRIARYEAAIAAANGLGFDNAMHALTMGAAEILGIADRVGSLEEGKDADVVLFDGDPFEYVTNVQAVIINGEVTFTNE
jgi:imidazolonepropionase-like amidohydrolase